MAKDRHLDLKHQKTSRQQIRRALSVGVVTIVVLICIAACGASLESSDGRGLRPPEAAQPMEVPAAEEALDTGSGTSASGEPGVVWAAEHLIIRTGNISMAVEDTRGAKAAIEQMVGSMAAEGAFVVSSNEYGGTEESQPYVSMAIRVPATRFDEIMDRLAELAVNVTSQSDSAEDVTEEYVDLEARLESMEAARQRLLDIMAEARTTKDLLEAEQQLTQREAEIESIKGRMQYLAESARLSSVWIELQPYILNQPVGDQWRPAETLRRAVDALLDGLRGFGDFLIFFGIAVLPWLVLLAVVVFVAVRIVRWVVRGRRKKSAQPESGE